MTAHDLGPIEAAILEVAHRRGAGRTLCPSDIARALAPDDWRPLMPTVRLAAGRLASQGRLVVTQRGQVVDITTARGPVRLGLPTTQALRT